MKSLEEKFYQVIRHDEDDIETLLAYSNHLKEQGDPRGEMIAIELALQSGHGRESEILSARLEQLEGEVRKDILDLPAEAEETVEVDWKYGFITRIIVDDAEGLDLLSRVIDTAKLDSVYSVSFSHVGEDRLPDWVARLSQLTELELRENALTGLPQWIAGLRQLRVLDLGDNRLSALPDFAGDLSCLRRLDLEHNGFDEVPQCVAKLSRLEVLKLGHNCLSAIPEWLGDLQQLRVLDIGHNDFSDFDVIPDSLGRLARLEELVLDAGNLTRFPAWIAGLEQLRSLSVSENMITEIPSWLGRLPRLRSLDFSGNRISSVPDWCAGLDELDFDRNPLTQLPQAVREKHDPDDAGGGAVLASAFSSLEEIERSLGEAHDTLQRSVNRMKRLMAVAFIGVICAVATIGFMIAAAYSTGSTRQTMILLYYLSYAGGVATTLVIDAALHSVVSAVSPGAGAGKSVFVRLLAIAVLSALGAVLLHWLFFWDAAPGS